MGHQHTLKLPDTAPWRNVVGLVDAGAAEGPVAAAAARAARRELMDATRDPVFIEAVRLLVELPRAMRDPRPVTALNGIGLTVSDEPSLPGLLIAVSSTLRSIDPPNGAGRTDLGEIARGALLGAVTDLVSLDLPGLLEVEPSDVTAAVGRLDGRAAFSGFARAFFGRVVRHALASWLDRALPARVGEGRRFETLDDLRAFDDALDQHVAEATRIIREFSWGWRAVRLRERDRLAPGEARDFAHVAMKKIVEELEVKAASNG